MCQADFLVQGNRFVKNTFPAKLLYQIIGAATGLGTDHVPVIDLSILDINLDDRFPDLVFIHESSDDRPALVIFFHVKIAKRSRERALDAQVLKFLRHLLLETELQPPLVLDRDDGGRDAMFLRERRNGAQDVRMETYGYNDIAPRDLLWQEFFRLVNELGHLTLDLVKSLDATCMSTIWDTTMVATSPTRRAKIHVVDQVARDALCEHVLVNDEQIHYIIP